MIEKEVKKIRFKSEDGLELVGIWHLPDQNEFYQDQAKKNKKVILIIPRQLAAGKKSEWGFSPRGSLICRLN